MKQLVRIFIAPIVIQLVAMPVLSTPVAYATTPVAIDERWIENAEREVQAMMQSNASLDSRMAAMNELFGLIRSSFGRAAEVNPALDFNTDSRIDLTDFSVLKNVMVEEQGEPSNEPIDPDDEITPLSVDIAQAFQTGELRWFKIDQSDIGTLIIDINWIKTKLVPQVPGGVDTTTIFTIKTSPAAGSELIATIDIAPLTDINLSTVTVEVNLAALQGRGEVGLFISGFKGTELFADPAFLGNVTVAHANVVLPGATQEAISAILDTAIEVKNFDQSDVVTVEFNTDMIQNLLDLISNHAASQDGSVTADEVLNNTFLRVFVLKDGDLGLVQRYDVVVSLKDLLNASEDDIEKLFRTITLDPADSPYDMFVHIVGSGLKFDSTQWKKIADNVTVTTTNPYLGVIANAAELFTLDTNPDGSSRVEIHIDADALRSIFSNNGIIPENIKDEALLRFIVDSIKRPNNTVQTLNQELFVVTFERILAELNKILPVAASELGVWFDFNQDLNSTGLLVSFPDHANITGQTQLINQSSTYDQGVASMAFALEGNTASVAQMLAVYRQIMNANSPGGVFTGFKNFYNTQDPLNGASLEADVTLGPNTWVALAALIEGDTEMAKKIFFDVITKLPRSQDGGVAKGMAGSNFASTFVTEENAGLLGFLEKLSRLEDLTNGERNVITSMRNDVRNFIKNRFRSTTQLFDRSSTNDAATPALDAQSFVLLGADLDWLVNEVLSPAGVSVDGWIQHIESTFGVFDGGTLLGFDFSDSINAVQAGRERTIWIEGTNQMVVGYQRLAQYYAGLGDSNKAAEYQGKADALLAQNANRRIEQNGNRVSYAYTTGEQGEKAFWDINNGTIPSGSSIASTAWVSFAEHGFNPLDPTVVPSEELVFQTDLVNYGIGTATISVQPVASGYKPSNPTVIGQVQIIRSSNEAFRTEILLFQNALNASPQKEAIRDLIQSAFFNAAPGGPVTIDLLGALTEEQLQILAESFSSLFYDRDGARTHAETIHAFGLVVETFNVYNTYDESNREKLNEVLSSVKPNINLANGISTSDEVTEIIGLRYSIEEEIVPAAEVLDGFLFAADLLSIYRNLGESQRSDVDQALIKINPVLTLNNGYQTSNEVGVAIGLGYIEVDGSNVADINANGRVDLADFNILKTNFGQNGTYDEGDINRDGVVNLADFAILKTNFGQEGGKEIVQISAQEVIEGFLVAGEIVQAYQGKTAEERQRIDIITRVLPNPFDLSNGISDEESENVIGAFFNEDGERLVTDQVLVGWIAAGEFVQRYNALTPIQKTQVDSISKILQTPFDLSNGLQVTEAINEIANIIGVSFNSAGERISTETIIATYLDVAEFVQIFNALPLAQKQAMDSITNQLLKPFDILDGLEVNDTVNEIDSIISNLYDVENNRLDTEDVINAFLVVADFMIAYNGLSAQNKARVNAVTQIIEKPFDVSDGLTVNETINEIANIIDSSYDIDGERVPAAQLVQGYLIAGEVLDAYNALSSEDRAKVDAISTRVAKPFNLSDGLQNADVAPINDNSFEEGSNGSAVRIPADELMQNLLGLHRADTEAKRLRDAINVLNDTDRGYVSTVLSDAFNVTDLFSDPISIDTLVTFLDNGVLYSDPNATVPRNHADTAHFYKYVGKFVTDYDQLGDADKTKMNNFLANRLIVLNDESHLDPDDIGYFASKGLYNFGTRTGLSVAQILAIIG